MPKKYMNDFQRVKAGNWIEAQRTWIETRPATSEIIAAAEKELGHRVTESFVRAYLPQTDWFTKAKKDPKNEDERLEDMRSAMVLTLDAFMRVVEGEPISSREIDSTIRKAKSLMRSSRKNEKIGQLDLITKEQMEAGHA